MSKSWGRRLHKCACADMYAYIHTHYLQTLTLSMNLQYLHSSECTRRSHVRSVCLLSVYGFCFSILPMWHFDLTFIILHEIGRQIKVKKQLALLYCVRHFAGMSNETHMGDFEVTFFITSNKTTNNFSTIIKNSWGDCF